MALNIKNALVESLATEITEMTGESKTEAIRRALEERKQRLSFQVVHENRADELRYKAFEIKMRQLDATGAELTVTSCANCRQTFDDGQAHSKWDRTMGSLLELVAEHLRD